MLCKVTTPAHLKGSSREATPSEGMVENRREKLNYSCTKKDLGEMVIERLRAMKIFINTLPQVEPHCNVVHKHLTLCVRTFPVYKEWTTMRMEEKTRSMLWVKNDLLRQLEL